MSIPRHLNIILASDDVLKLQQALADWEPAVKSGIALSVQFLLHNITKGEGPGEAPLWNAKALVVRLRDNDTALAHLPNRANVIVDEIQWELTQ